MWWSQVGTLLVGFLGVAAGANWFSRRATRQVRDLKAHADLWSAMPDGPGKWSLDRHLQRAVRQHVVQLDSAAAQAWLTVARALLVVPTGIAAAIGVALSVVSPFMDDLPGWWIPTQVAAAVVGVVGLIATAGATVMAGRAMKSAKEARPLDDDE